MWAIIGGYIKSYGGTEADVLNKSYRNVIMYNAVLPSYSAGKTNDKEQKLNASDPKNKEAVHKIMFG